LVVTLAPTGYVDHVLSTQIAAGLCIGYLECSAATGILIPNVPSNSRRPLYIADNGLPTFVHMNVLDTEIAARRFAGVEEPQLGLHKPH
jgi:hypothetical protein